LLLPLLWLPPLLRKLLKLSFVESVKKLIAASEECKRKKLAVSVSVMRKTVVVPTQVPLLQVLLALLIGVEVLLAVDPVSEVEIPVVVVLLAIGKCRPVKFARFRGSFGAPESAFDI
jgi:hypothetical protein